MSRTLREHNPQESTVLTDRPVPAPDVLPTGTVTFLFTDIEGSTRLLQDVGPRYADLLERHRRLIDDAVTRHGGVTFGSEGDALFAAFADAPAAILAATEAQRALQAEPWPEGQAIHVRMGIHTGEATLANQQYVGLSLHQVARIVGASHGDQALVSGATRELAIAALPEGLDLRDLGEHRLRDLARPERLYQLVGPGLRADFDPPRTLTGRPNNLPVQLTSFVGRREIDDARALLAGTRLLTLTGPGGTGKTRLALQLAAEVVDDFPDGVYFVALDAVDDHELVPSTIALALGMDAGAGAPLDRLAEHLRDRRALLVLDNFEQVVDAAPGIARILREAPLVKAVVTSRIVLRTYGEQEFAVPPLGLPVAGTTDPAVIGQSEAVRLFVERAMASLPAFRLDPANAAAVADIVTRLDGLPLAIELAAARLRIFPVEALRGRLDQRLAMLTGGARDLPARQQTLRGAIDWSYDLLDEPDRRLFARLAVFAGGASLGEAEAVAGPASDLGREVLDGLLSLTEKSLLRSVGSPDDEPRFAMLATIREYGLEVLDRDAAEADAVRRRHAAAFLALVERCAVSWSRPEGRATLDRLAVDHDNVRAAIDWAVARGEAETAHRLATGAWRFWQQRGHLDEAHARLPAVLATPGSDALPAATRARTLGAAGSVEYWRGNEPDTHHYYVAALEAARASGDRPLLAEALYNMGFAFRRTFGTVDERYTAGRESWEEALGIYRELGDQRGVAGATWALAIAYLTIRDFDSARDFLGRSIELYRGLGDTFGLAWAYHMLGLTELSSGDQRAAEAQFRQALDLFIKSGDQSGILLCLLDFAGVARVDGDEARYWRLNGAASELRRTTGAGISNLQFAAGFTWVLEEAPAEPDRLRWFREGEALSTDAAVAEALGQPASRDP